MYSSNAHSFVGVNRDSETTLQSIGQYIEDYIDLVENVPNEIVRHITQLHEKNHYFHKLLAKLEKIVGRPVSSDGDQAAKTLDLIQSYLISIQMVSDEKLNLVQSIYEHLEVKGKQLDIDLRAVKSGNGDMFPASPTKGPAISDREAAEAADFLSFVANHNVGSVPPAIVLEKKTSEQNGHRGSTSNDGHPRNGNGHVSSEETAYETKPYATSNGKVGGFCRQKPGFRRPGGRNPAAPPKEELSDHDSPSLTQSSSSGSPVKMGRGVKRGHQTSARGSSKRPDASGSQRRSKRDTSPTSLFEEPYPDDPDEPTYCLCNQISFGEMIGCDNDTCALEWFHFQCVSLSTKPKGKWYCPNCRGDSSSRPKKQ